MVVPNGGGASPMRDEGRAALRNMPVSCRRVFGASRAEIEVERANV